MIIIKLLRKIMMFVSILAIFKTTEVVKADWLSDFKESLDAELEPLEYSYDGEPYGNLSDEEMTLNQLLVAVGLDPKNYVEKEDASLVKYRAYNKKFTNNYQNFTVENINTYLSEDNLTFNDIVSAFGEPDLIWFDEDNDYYNEEVYTIDAWWLSTEEKYLGSTAKYGSEEYYKNLGTVADQFMITWKVPYKSDAIYKVSGVPTDANKRLNQDIISIIDGFTPATYE